MIVQCMTFPRSDLRGFILLFRRKKTSKVVQICQKKKLKKRKIRKTIKLKQETPLGQVFA